MKELDIIDIQKISLNILIEFDSFCRKNALSYYLAWGTLLGAVRHKGFIPWDDDIDVFMPRPDFERFQREYQDNDRFKLYSLKRQKQYCLTHMKLCDVNTYQVLPTGNIDERGVDIDIFALDGQESDYSEAEDEFNRLHEKFKRFVLKPNDWRYLKRTSLKNGLKLFLVSFGIKLGFINLMAQKLDASFSKTDFSSSQRVSETHAIFSSGYLNWDKSLFGNPIELEFEGFLFKAPSGYDEILQSMYGDYMQLPPVEKRQSTHLEKYYRKNTNS